MKPLLTAEDFLDEFRSRLGKARSLSKAVRTHPPRQQVPDTPRLWTNALLNLVLRWGRQAGFTVYPKGRIYDIKRKQNLYVGSEYLFDAAWYVTEDERIQYWKVAQWSPRPKNGFILCVESEWAGRTSKEQFDEMMDDFAKLTEAKADLKIFIGAYKPRGKVGGKPMLDEFLRVAELYAMTHRWVYPGEQYLIMLWKNEAEWKKDRNDFHAKIIRPPCGPQLTRDVRRRRTRGLLAKKKRRQR